jgi:MFS transporter, UMF1 family
MDEEASGAEGARGGGDPGSASRRRLAKWAWIIADAAKMPYFALVSLFVFSAYFTATVVGDPVRGQVLWSQISTIAAFALAIGAPVLGAIADAGGHRKRWIALFSALAVPGMVCLAFATPNMGQDVYWIMAALLAAALGLEFIPIFMNSLLPTVAKPNEVGAVSGLGMAVSNVLNFSSVLFFLLAWSWNPNPLFGLELSAGEPQRAVGPLAAIIFVAFSLPFFFLTPDSAKATVKVREAVGRAFQSILKTFEKLRSYPNIAVYMGARIVYSDGFIVLTLFTGVYAAGIMHWSATTIAVQGLINSACAMLGGLLAGFIDRSIGTKRSIIVAVAGCLAANITLCFVNPNVIFFIPVVSDPTATGLFPHVADKIFSVAQGSIALFAATGVAASRTILVKMAPAQMLGEFFGLFALTGTATSFLGPLAIGLVTSYFQSQQAGVGVGVAFLSVGLIWMFFVKEPTGEDSQPAS